MNKCEFCLKEVGYVTHKGRPLKWRPLRFCNRSCSRKFQVKSLIKIIKCLHCGIEFEKWNRKTKHSRLFCSRKCSGTNTFNKLYGWNGEKKQRKKYKQLYINKKSIYEHRFIMEQKIGRKLERWEHIHHINGNGLDNRLENLVLLSNSEHQKIEYLEKIKLTSS